MQLAHANRVATMGQLTASIAHEVNQPIAATVTNAQAALRWLSAEPPNLDEVAASARPHCQGRQPGGRRRRPDSRLSSRRRRRATSAWTINAAIREVIELTRSEAMKNGVSVQTDLAEGLPLVQGDRVELQQVILNLILNAIEAMSGDQRRAAGTADQRRARPSRATCSSRCAIRARDWRRPLSSISSRPSTRPSRTAWGWGCRSAVRSSKRTADDCGRAPMRPRRCLSIHLARP